MRRVSTLRTAALLALLHLALPAVPASAEPPTSPPTRARPAPGEFALDLSLELAPATRTVRGTARWTVSNGTERSLAALPFRLYANRFAERPSWLTGLTWYRVFPGGFSAGGTRLVAVRVDDAPAPLPPGDGHPLRVLVPFERPLAPGGRAVVELDFETRVPERYGPFGAVGDALTLEGGWYPAPLAPAPTGSRDDLPAADAPARVSLVVDAPGHVLVGGVHRAVRPGAAIGPIHLPGPGPVSLLYRARAARLGAGRGRVRLVHPPPRRGVPASGSAPGAEDPTTGAPAWPRTEDLGPVDTAGETVRTVAVGLSFLDARAPLLAGQRVTLAVAPLRRDLALPAPGLVLVSDRLLRVTPMERIRKFHRTALVRAVFAAVARERLGPREDAGDRGWTADVVAEHLSRAFVVARYGVREDAFDVLAPAAFVETVDDVLYAPQMPFASAYFNVVDDTDPARDRYELAFGTRPTGRRLYEKLRDRLGDEGLDALVSAYLRPGAGPLRALPGAPPAAFFERWLGAYPAFNVRLVEVSSRRAPDGRGYVHTAVVAREGASPLSDEPVTVRFELSDGSVQDRRWARAEGEARVEVRADAPLAAVRLDPLGRLVQWLPDATEDLRLDDRSVPDVKVLLGRVFVTLTPSAGDFSALAELLVQRRHDLRHRFGLLPFVVPERAGAALSYRYAFGPRVTANRLAAFLGVSLRAAGVEDDGGSYEPGFSAQLSLGYTDALTFFDSMRQNELLGMARYLASPDGGGLRHGAQFEVGGAVVRAPHPGHRLAARVDLGASVGEIASGERFGLGGQGGVRALGVSERRATHRMVLGLEYRHTWTRALSVSALRLAWWQGLEGVLFVDAGATADDWRDMADAERFVVGVGYGLRFHAELFGVQPALLSLDLAYPLPLTAAVRARTGPPLGVHVFFTQSF